MYALPHIRHLCYLNISAQCRYAMGYHQMLSSHGAQNIEFASLPVLICRLDCRLMHRNDRRSLPTDAAMGLLHFHVSLLWLSYALILANALMQTSAVYDLLPTAQEVCHRRPGLTR